MKLYFLDIKILKEYIHNKEIFYLLEDFEKFTIIPPEGINSNYYSNKNELFNPKNLILSIVFKRRIFLEDNELLELNDIIPNLFIVSNEIYDWFVNKIFKIDLFKQKINNKQIITLSDFNLENLFFKLLEVLYKDIQKEFKQKESTNILLNNGYFIGNNVVIGNNSRIYPFVYIGNNVYIGSNVKIYSNVSIYDNVYIGDNVIIHSNTTIGSDGFGYTDDLEKIYQIGGVVIKDNVEIGANVSIDRATIGYTFIAENTKIDNQVQIGHNVKVGKNCRIVSKVGIAGSARIYDNCILAAMSGVKDGIKIGPNTILAGNTIATKNLEPNKIYAGYPPKEFSKHFRDLAIIQKIVDSYEKKEK
jgi:UDP-3-O-[3-hydroxymyristoyl] glucosamine N-acyltransferase